METEIVCTGLLDPSAFTALIASCTFLQGAILLLEKLPQHRVGPEERQGLLRCERFDASMLDESGDAFIRFADYTSGRIFAQDFELRWEHERDKIHVVYVGTERSILPLKVARNAGLDTLEKHTSVKHYYLFGERLRKESLAIIGPQKEQGNFAELRIPRLLHYPFSAEEKGRYVQLSVQEYREKSTGRVMLFRFQAVKAVE